MVLLCLLFITFRIRLVRKTLPGVFMFEYQLPTFGTPYTNHSGGYHSGGGNVYSSAQSSGSGKMSPSYRMPMEQNVNPPLTLDVENDLPSVLQFPIGINDIGGTLVVELGVNNGRVREGSHCFVLTQKVNFLFVDVGVQNVN